MLIVQSLTKVIKYVINAQQAVWQNAGLTSRNINFCFAIVLQLSGRRNFTHQKILS